MHFRYYDEYLQEQKKVKNKMICKEKKKVICLETGKIFESVSDCAREEETFTSSISNACKGVYKTTGGKHYRYYEDYMKEMKG